MILNYEPNHSDATAVLIRCRFQSIAFDQSTQSNPRKLKTFFRESKLQLFLFIDNLARYIYPFY
jgi:hypothetical protein